MLLSRPVCVAAVLIIGGRLAHGCRLSHDHHDLASYPACTPAQRPLQLDGPHTCVGDVCVYADQRFRGGLAMAVTHDNARRVAEMPVAAAVYERTAVQPPPFIEVHVPGKGVGLVANTTIRKGDAVMVLTPTLLLDLETHSALEPAARRGLYTAVMQRLPAAARRAFMRQMGADVYEKAETNCFRLFLDSQAESTGHLGCFPAAARLNHDCRPKCVRRDGG